jgi:hypothetical protein
MPAGSHPARIRHQSHVGNRLLHCRRLSRALLRYAAPAHETPKICLSQQEFAKMVGATRENVNRGLRE